MDEAAAAAGHPWMLYAGLVFGILILAATAVPKILGPLGTGLSEWAKNQRAAASDEDDADIAERDRQIAYLQGVAAERLREIKARDALVAEHSQWDWERYGAAVKAGHDVAPPPPLIPDIPKAPGM